MKFYFKTKTNFIVLFDNQSMQNQPKKVKTSKHRSPTTTTKSKSHKDDFDNTRSTHQTNIRGNMIEVPHSEDSVRVMKTSIKKSSFTDFEQRITFLERNLSSYERVQEKVERNLNNILGNDKYFGSNSSDHLKSILIDTDHTKFTITSQLLESKAFTTLQNLDLSNAFLQTKEILILSQNCSLQSLKVLNLSGNPIGNSGIEFIAENSNWNDIYTLILRDIQIDDRGAQYLAANESWMNLEELDLSQNPLLGNLGSIHLSYNRAWIHIKRLLLYDCNVGTIGVKYLQRNRLLTLGGENEIFGQDAKLFEKNREESERRKPTEDLFVDRTKSLEPDKRNSHVLNNLQNEAHQEITWNLRGGFPDVDDINSGYRYLLSKFEQHREKILSKNNNQGEHDLYIDISTRSKDRNLPELKEEQEGKD